MVGITIVILDTSGHLVSNAQVVLNISDPDGSINDYSTEDDSILMIDTGIYKVSRC